MFHLFYCLDKNFLSILTLEVAHSAPILILGTQEESETSISFVFYLLVQVGGTLNEHSSFK